MPVQVIYLDDEADLCEAFKDNLEGDDLVLETFTDANEAIAAIKYIRPDIVLIDFRLSEGTAESILPHIPLNIPVALVTGDWRHGPDKRFERIFMKPYDFDEARTFLLSFRK